VVWSAVFLKLGLLLLAIGLLPALVVAYLLRGVDSLVPGLLALSVAPLGALALVVAALLWLVERLRR